MLFFDDDEEEELDLADTELDDEDPDDDDGESDDDEDEPEDDGESEDDEDEPQVKAKGKRENDRIRRLTEARREKERENIELKKQLDQARAGQTQPTNPQNNLAARQAWLNSLPAADRSQAELRIAMQDHAQMMQVQQFNMADSADKAQYDAKAISNSTYARYAARVEQKLASLRNEQGITAPREEVLKHIIGEAVLKIKGKATSKKDAKASVTKNKVKPGANKKNDLNGGSRQGKTARDRLEGVKF